MAKEIVGWYTRNGKHVPVYKGEGMKAKKGEGSKKVKGSPSKVTSSDHDRAVANAMKNKEQVRKEYEDYMSKLKTLKGKEREELIKKASRG